MIQRIQSLFLLIAIACSIAAFFLDFSICSSDQGMVRLSLMSTSDPTASVQQTSSVDLLIINILTLVMGVWALFSFQNRSRQMRISMIGGLTSIVMVILIFYHTDDLQGNTQAQYLAGTYLIAIQTVAFTLARRFIRKDELLVRSADRIR